MSTFFRKSPPVCLVLSLLRLTLGRLRFSNQMTGGTIQINDGEEFRIFRHISRYPFHWNNSTTVFIVNFKFSRLSHRANKIASIIPMLLITGFPGFNIKIYCVNLQNGFWQGMYQWESIQALEEYKKSFVFKVMNKRAIKSSIKSIEIHNKRLSEYFDNQ